MVDVHLTKAMLSLTSVRIELPATNSAPPLDASLFSNRTRSPTVMFDSFVCMPATIPEAALPVKQELVASNTVLSRYTPPVNVRVVGGFAAR